VNRRVSMHIDARGLRELSDALEKIQTEGIPRAQRELDAALDRTAETSYGLAHLDEGQLRGSQTYSSAWGRSSWEGQIAYTGRGAAFEMAKGGEHAGFIDSLSSLSVPDFEAALDSMFRDL
jgi:hypothetical protein